MRAERGVVSPDCFSALGVVAEAGVGSGDGDLNLDRDERRVDLDGSGLKVRATRCSGLKYSFAFLEAFCNFSTLGERRFGVTERSLCLPFSLEGIVAGTSIGSVKASKNGSSLTG